MKKHEKKEEIKNTEFDEDESVGDAALAQDKENVEETKPIDEDASIGNSNMNEKKNRQLQQVEPEKQTVYVKCCFING